MLSGQKCYLALNFTNSRLGKMTNFPTFPLYFSGVWTSVSEFAGTQCLATMYTIMLLRLAMNLGTFSVQI